VSAVVDVVLSTQVVVLGAQEDSHVHIGRFVAGNVDGVGVGLVVQACQACAVVDVLAIFGRLYVQHVVEVDVEVVEVRDQLIDVHILDFNTWVSELSK